MRIFQVDAFTRTRFTGNPATVVLDADGLEDARARKHRPRIPARRDRLRARRDGTRSRCADEILQRPQGIAVRRARDHRRPCGTADARPARAGAIRQLSGTGVIEVRASEATAAAARECLIEFRQGAAELEDPLPLKTTLRIAEALRLQATRLHESLPARIARKGSTRLLLPVSDSAALDALAPNHSASRRSAPKSAPTGSSYSP